MPSRVPDGSSRGWIIPIGGAENKENDRRILERFVRVSGGEAADSVVIPTGEPRARDRAALRADAASSGLAMGNRPANVSRKALATAFTSWPLATQCARCLSYTIRSQASAAV